jgi:hypothetical protein
VHQLEARSTQPRRATLDVIRRGFENAGVDFIDENEVECDFASGQNKNRETKFGGAIKRAQIRAAKKRGTSKGPPTTRSSNR